MHRGSAPDISFFEPELSVAALQSTGYDLQSAPSESALAEIEDPQRVQRFGRTSSAKRPRHAHKSDADADLVDQQYAAREARMRDRLLRREPSKEQPSNIRKTPKRGKEDYRHSRLVLLAEPKRRDSFESPNSKRVRRSARPSFEHEPDEEASSMPALEDGSSGSPRARKKNSKSAESAESASDTEPPSRLSSPDPATDAEVGAPQSSGIVNNDWCASCGGSGVLLCCEGCANSFHFSCTQPPIMSESEISGEVWKCRKCAPVPLADDEKRDVDCTLFASMIPVFASSNPTTFKLPRDLRIMFEEVEETKTGELKTKYMISKRPIHEDGLHDKNGRVLLCYTCQGSGLSCPLAKCAECDAAWHIDCLTPPLSAAPRGYWVCPLHASTVAGYPRKPKTPIQRRVILPRNVKNDGNIEVVDGDSFDDDSTAADMTSTAAIDSLDTNGEDAHDITENDDETAGAGSCVPEELDNSLSETNLRVLADEYEELQSEDEVRQVKFPAESHVDEDGLIYHHSTRQRMAENNDKVLFQVPARTIKLDFIEAVRDLRSDPYKPDLRSEIMGALNELASKPDSEKEVVRDLASLKLQGPAVDVALARKNMCTLVEAALNSEDEIGQIAAIRKLMLEKGKDKLMRMLLNS